jgi:transcriptional regulator with XRE-family HTH domain
MELHRMLQRIDRRLEALGLSQDAASKRAGKPDFIRNLRRRVEDDAPYQPKAETIAALARELRTTTSWLVDEIGPEDTDEESPSIPVKGKVGAGGLVIPVDDTEIGRIPAPKNANMHTAAVEIEGESLGILFEGWFAVYDEVRTPPTEDLIGKTCVVQLADGRAYIKKLTKGRGKKFTLVSNYDPPIYDVVVTWAAEVKEIVRG